MATMSKVTSSDYTASSEGDRFRFPAYIYPSRHPSYKKLLEDWPPKSGTRGYSNVIRRLFFEGYPQAKIEMEDWFERLRGVKDESEELPPIVDLPVVASRDKTRYDIYLVRNKTLHLPVIEYLIHEIPIIEWEMNERFNIRKLKVHQWKGRLRQRLLILSLVRGSEIPDILERIRKDI
jgi:hypothetical protein